MIVLLGHNQGDFYMANKYTYTKEKRDPQIQWYPTKQGKRWRVKFAFVVRGKTVHIEKQGFKSFDEARAFKAKAYDNEMENRVTVHKRYTVDDYWRIYADNKVKSGAWRSSTAYAREQGYKAYLKDYWGKVLLKDVTRLEYQNWLSDYVIKHDLAKSTSQHITAMMGGIMSDALVNELITRNPIKKITNSGREPQDLSLTRKQYDQVLDYMRYSPDLNATQRGVIVLAAHALRRSEVAGMKLKYFHGDYVDVLGQLNGYGDYTDVKSVASRRSVPLTKEARDILLEAIARARGIYLLNGRPMTDDDFIFVNDSGGPFYTQYITVLFKKMSRDLEFHIAPHMLRHAFSTFAFGLEGANPRDISNIMGHKNVSMSLYYNLGTDDGKRELIDKLDEDLRSNG
ncbi:site-specific integrase [Weissella cibaria]|nr:site-specific integrase [Weissella cibaria]RHE79494.1 site-specific integrase [Weissella cibaria]